MLEPSRCTLGCGARHGACVVASCLVASVARAGEHDVVHEALSDPTPLERAYVPDEQDARWGHGRARSFLVPAAEILAFQGALNLFDRHAVDAETYGTDFDSIESNLHHGWVIDRDPFSTNQFLHPYQGSIYHGFARSAGLTYWEALGYDFAASGVWEIAGETDPPSLNDQITTSFGGSFLGEALFRMASLLLEGADGRPGLWRSLGAAAISPANGVTRFAFGDRFDGVYPSRGPATNVELGLGYRRNERISDLNLEEDVQKDGAQLLAKVDYGLPGRDGYEYTRPFDYFRFEAVGATNTDRVVDTLSVRGLLWGTDYRWGDDWRGIWGLYGTYDYASPGLFSISSTALSVGTTAQTWLSDSVALQTTGLLGGGWAATGTIADEQEDRDYHYGAAPMSVLDVRAIFGDAVMFGIAGRDDYVSTYGSQDRGDAENVVHATAELLVRVWGRHALGVQVVTSSRTAHFLEIPDQDQTVGALTFFYAYLSDERFGAVPWGGHGRD